ncbi:chorismate mutase [Candidatus Lucifugimonas marina]|uniref:Chorismate mutase n=1 Tax=Candidatus Lucifugimonas marina TaxID=3038979 RepID=A0AAJ5ZHX8_9CHLR|nr:chorismate mutase [SAR202 cluster bacterium JH702]MDG0869808.1 chorismate mutase [SAR202 cluster bacterium JH639]WFG34535.1 chorismate mutase [SAR202 cluster bacterium JH545]WFG38463.1 chorismate mutase [SAR202 cluster bacterium JH1073]
MATKVRGVKGATTTHGTTAEDVLSATEQLLSTLIEANSIDQDDVAAVQFTTSPDLVAEFPAVAARERLGWNDVPLMCGHEMARPGALSQCIRILIFWNTDKAQNEVRHAYLNEAAKLRPDLSTASN